MGDTAQVREAAKFTEGGKEGGGMAAGTEQQMPARTRQRMAAGAEQQMPVRTRQRMSAEERRESVLEAALPEFAIGGLAGTSTEDVARRAGISQPYLFRLYPTKKALFLALIERCFDRVEAAFTAAADGKTGEDAMDAMAGAYDDLLEDRTLLLLQLQAYAACADEEIRIEVRTRYRHLWELAERLTGLPFDEVVQFFAMGMLLNVGAALDLRGVDERWAEWCGTDTAKTDVPTA